MKTNDELEALKKSYERTLKEANDRIAELTFTEQEKNYLLTLCNHNANGEQFAPAMPEVAEKLRRL